MCLLSHLIKNSENTRGVMVKVLDYNIVESEFELHSRYCVHLRTNTLWKDINILPVLSLIL